MGAIVRTIVYATVFVAVLLIYVPVALIERFGIEHPTVIGMPQYLGFALGSVGAAVTLWCIASFAIHGRGTPAPFDPPRRLVARGLYCFIRNPMYLGAVLALTGAAAFYESIALLGYAGLFLVVTHLFVVAYEEPTLRRTFGDDYVAYCLRTGRWLPRLRRPQRKNASS